MIAVSKRSPQTGRNDPAEWSFCFVALGLAGAHGLLGFTIRNALTPLALWKDPELMAMWICGIDLAQAALVGLFLSLGPTRLFWRLPIATAAMVLLFAFNWPIGSGMREIALVVFTGAPFVSTAMIGWQLRELGWRCVRNNHGLSSPTSRLRFTISDIFVMTAAIATAMAIVRGAREILDGGWQVVAVFGLLPIIAGTILNPLLALWSSLVPGPLLIRSACYFTILLGCCVAPPFIGKANSETYAMILIPLLMQAVLLIASLLVIRACGYRLAWAARTAEVRFNRT